MSRPPTAGGSPQASAFPGADAGTGSGPQSGALDLEALADKVYRLLLEDLRLERVRTARSER